MTLCRHLEVLELLGTLGKKWAPGKIGGREYVLESGSEAKCPT